jgi:starch phosphorylase
MYKSTQEFKERYLELCNEHFADSPEVLGPLEQYLALATLLSEEIRSMWAQSRDKHRDGKKVYYFSSEFLIGHLLSQNIKALQASDIIEAGLKDFGISLDELLVLEKDAGLGNGGLGRLAACFMDSMTHLGIAGRGNSIRYQHGFFKQVIENFEQKEVAENWLENGYPWETKRPGRAQMVRFGGKVNIEYKEGRLFFSHVDYWEVKAVPYEISILSNDTLPHVNSLRLWDAEAVDGFDFSAYDRGDYRGAVKKQIEADNLTQVLYPNDSRDSGKRLRLMQEYFFVSAGIMAIIKEYVTHHDSIEGIEDNVCVHINDTHPALCIPELLRIFIDEYDMKWEKAWDITRKMVSYTNHTILPEALETWHIDLMRQVQPRVCMIIEEINRRFVDSLMDNPDIDNSIIPKVEVIRSGWIHMAGLSVLGSHSVNGVAELHTEILKAMVMKPYFDLFPERFNNKTNGISHRVFLINSNEKLADLFDESIGAHWKEDTYELKKLIGFKEDGAFIDKFKKIKDDNKLALSGIIKDITGYIIDPHSIFDIQVKRIHAYKRQLLNILGIMYRCRRDPSYLENMHPHTFIFAGKAAPSYSYAKSIIRLALRLAERVNNDPVLSKKMRVVFLPNFNVSLAGHIYPAADISQQISTAGMEASGTGNMKFMMNGAVTLGTLDGANVEISELVGPENIVIFGMSADEVNVTRSMGYDPMKYMLDPKMREVVNMLQTGFFMGDMHQFDDIYRSLTQEGDYFLVLKDFESYIDACMKCENLYTDNHKFVKMQIHNIAMSGHFSSDRTIREYSRDIWKVDTK